MPTEFHRAGLLYRSSEPKWWRPLLEFVLLALLVVAFTLAVAVPTGFAAGYFGLDIFDEASTDPLVSLLQVLFIAVLLPAPFIAARVVGRKPGALHSIEGRFRWGVAGRAFAVVLAVYGGLVLFETVVFGTDGVSVGRREALLLAAFVVLVPLQAAAEEYIFRASLPQILGQWNAPGWLCYGLPAVGFVASHVYNWVGLVDIAIFALCAALLTWRTGGVEAAIMLHAVSNTIVFAYGAIGVSNPGETEIALSEMAVSSLITLGATVLLLWALKDAGANPRRKIVVPHHGNLYSDR